LTCRHEKLLSLKFCTANSHIQTLKIDLKPMTSDMACLKFAFEVRFHNLKTNFSILVLK